MIEEKGNHVTSVSTGRVDPGIVLGDNPVIAVLRARHAGQYPPVVEALLAGGVRAIELTLSTAGVFDEFESLATSFGRDASIGIGTVTTVEQAASAISAGAAFVVTPTMEHDVVGACVRARVPVFPGGLTPTELHRGWSAGASAVKLFPASTVGPGYIGQLRGPFPDIQAIPSGGVGIEDTAEWVRAGAVAVSLGGPLLGDAFDGGDLGALTQRALRVSAVVHDAMAERR
jgi:2-dehydro-3-deoxyphosphogluconate aldolase / (4S)-4-hydroxy-2-oxoglutarate aldolase